MLPYKAIINENNDSTTYVENYDNSTSSNDGDVFHDTYLSYIPTTESHYIARTSFADSEPFFPLEGALSEATDAPSDGENGRVAGPHYDVCRPTPVADSGPFCSLEADLSYWDTAEAPTDGENGPTVNETETCKYDPPPGINIPQNFLSYSPVDVSTIKTLLDNGSFWSEFSIVKAKADGHCIIYSLCICMRALLLNSDDMFEYSDMLLRLRSECLSNMPLYIIAIMDCSPVYMILEMIRYIYFKGYNSSFVDIVPHIMAQVLSVNVYIIEERLNGVCDVHSANITETSATSNVFIYKKGDHYDACIPNSIQD